MNFERDLSDSDYTWNLPSLHILLALFFTRVASATGTFDFCMALGSSFVYFVYLRRGKKSLDKTSW
jgi:hypothetical protein